MGGYSSITQIDTSNSGNYYPILFYISNDGYYEWAKYIDSLQLGIETVTFTTDTKTSVNILATLYDYTLEYYIFLIVSSSAGEINQMFYESSGKVNDIYNNAAALSADNQIFINAHQTLDKFLIFSMTSSGSGSFSPSWIFTEASSLSSEYSQGASLSLFPDKYLLVEFQIIFYKNYQYTTYQVLSKMSRDTGDLIYQIGVERATSQNYNSISIRNQDIQTFPDFDLICGCGQVKNSRIAPKISQNQIYFVKMKADNRIDDQRNIDLSGYNSCNDVSIESSSSLYVLINDQSTYHMNLYYFDFSNLISATIKQQTFWFKDFSDIYRGKIDNYFNPYYVGDIFNSLISSEYYQGFLTSMNVDQSCSSLDTGPTTTTFTSAFSSSSFSLVTFDMESTTLTLNDRSDVQLKEIFLETVKHEIGAFCSVNSIQTIDLTTTYSINHIIQDGDFSLSFKSLFDGDLSCNDISRKYTITLNEMNQVNFIFDEIDTLSSSQDKLVKSVNSVQVKVEIPNGSTTTLQIDIDVIDCSLDQYTLEFSIGSLIYTIKEHPQIISLSDFTQTYSQCAKPLIYLREDDNILKPSNLISLTQSDFVMTISSSNLISVGEYALSIIFPNKYNSNNDQFQKFTLKVLCQVKIYTSYAGTKIFTYMLDQEAIKISFTQNLYENDCGYTNSYSAFISNQNSLPTFIQYDSDFNVFTVETDSIQNLGTYEITIKTILNDLDQTFSESFKWNLNVIKDYSQGQNLYSPQFEEDLKPIEVRLGQSYVYNFPKIIDLDGDSFEVKVKQNIFYDFIRVDSSKITITPGDNVEPGFYVVDIKVIDNGQPPLDNSYKIQVHILDDEASEDQEDNENQDDDQNEQDSETGYDNQQQEEMTNQFKNLFQAFVAKQNMNGEIFIKINDQFKFNQEAGRFIDLYIQARDKLVITFQSLRFQRNLQQEQIGTTESDSDDQNSNNQKINNTDEKAEETNKNSEVFILECMLPKQVSKVHLPLFDIDFPANAYYLITYLINLTNVRILPENQIFNFSENLNRYQNNFEIQLDAFFQLLGYETLLILIQFKDFIVLLTIGLVFIAFDKSVQLIIREKFMRQFIKNDSKWFYYFSCLYKIIQGKFYYSWFLRLMIEGYLSINVILFKLIDSFYTTDDIYLNINIAMSLALTIFQCLAPIGVFYMIINNFKKLNEKVFSEKYSTLYENMNTKKKLFAYYLQIFLIRRIIFALCISLFEIKNDLGWVFCGLIISNILLNFMVLIFVVGAQIYQYAKRKIFEIKRQRLEVMLKKKVVRIMCEKAAQQTTMNTQIDLRIKDSQLQDIYEDDFMIHKDSSQNHQTVNPISQIEFYRPDYSISQGEDKTFSSGMHIQYYDFEMKEEQKKEENLVNRNQIDETIHLNLSRQDLLPFIASRAKNIVKVQSASKSNSKRKKNIQASYNKFISKF